MYKKHFRLILAVLCASIVGCQHPQNTETGTAEEIVPVMSGNETTSAADSTDRIAELENNARLLAEQISQKDTEITELENQLVSERETSRYIQAYADRANKTRRNILFVTLLSLILNIILGWFLYRAKKMPKRLALPEGRNDNGKVENNDPDNGPIPETNKKHSEQSRPYRETTESTTQTTTDIKIKTAEEPKKRRGRPKKNVSQIPPQSS